MQKIGRRKWLVGLAVTALCCMFFAALRSFKTMPLSEGWYTEYAWLVNHGELPYKDFECLFFPLYVFIIAGFTKIFGYSIIALRILGIVLSGMIGIAMYVLFTKLFDSFPAFIASVAATYYTTSKSGIIWYDYIKFHDFFGLLTIVFLVYFSYNAFYRKDNQKPVGAGIAATSKVLQAVTPALLVVLGVIGIAQSSGGDHVYRMAAFSVLSFAGVLWLALPLIAGRKSRKKYALDYLPMQSILCGIFVAAECMIRQSTGAIMVALVLVYLGFCAVVFRNGSFWKGLAGAVTGIFLAFGLLLAYLLLTGSFDGFIENCFHSAIAAKGGMLTELFAWIPRDWRVFWQNREIAFILIILIDLLIGWYVYRNKDEKRIESGSVLGIIVGGIAFAVLAWAFLHDRTLATLGFDQYGTASTRVYEIAFFTCAIAFACFGFYFLLAFVGKREISDKVKENFLLFPVLGYVVAQGWGAGTSGGLDCQSVAGAFGLVLGFCLQAAVSAKRMAITSGIVVTAYFLCAIFAGARAIDTYTWWSLTSGTIWDQTETADVPLLQGLQMRQEDKQYYETVYQDVIEHTSEGDSIFVFPHSPIIYTITGHHSDTYTKVQWFDVSSMASIKKDIATLRENPPKVLVYISLPDYVYEGHESGFKTMQTGKMRDFLLNELVVDYGYEMLHTVDLGNENQVITYCLPD